MLGKGPFWHTDGKDGTNILRTFITLVGNPTALYNDTDVRDKIDAINNSGPGFEPIYNNNNNTDNYLIDYSKVIHPSLGQAAIGVVGMEGTLHAAPCEYGGNRMLILLDKDNNAGDIEGPMDSSDIDNKKDCSFSNI